MFTFIKLFICENESLKVLNGNLPKNYVISMQELVDHRSFLPYPAYSTQRFVIIIHLSSSVNHTIFITCMCSQTSPLMSPSSSSSLPSNPLCFTSFIRLSLLPQDKAETHLHCTSFFGPCLLHLCQASIDHHLFSFFLSSAGS